jgi:PAS domain S-box-containing protein
MDAAKREAQDIEARYRSMFERILNGIAHCRMEYDDRGHPVDFVYLAVNAAFERLTGLNDVVGKKVSEVIPGIMELSPELLETYNRVASTGNPEVFEFDFKSLAKWLTISVYSPATGYFVAIFDDITERKLFDAKIQRQVRLYAALSHCNQAIVRCSSEAELFPKVCEAAVQFGKMRMAWVGLIDSETLMVRPVAGSGDGVDDLENANISTDADSPFGGGPTGIAIREHRPYWCQDITTDPVTVPWRKRSASHGWAATASLPLLRDGAVVGAFVLHSELVNAFDEPARGLLVEMASDISFALDNFSRETRRKRAKAKLNAAEDKFRGLVEQAIAGICIVQDGKLSYANPRCAEIVDQGSVDDLIGTDPLAWVTESDRGRVAEAMRRLLAGEAKSIAMEFGVLRRNGVVIQVGANSTFAIHDGRPAIIGMMQDISEKRRAEEEILRYVAQLKTAFMSTVEVATTISEMRDPYTAGHERRVAKIAVAIGAELGLDTSRQEGLRVAGDLHDVGKMIIPAEILSKPGRLSEAEMQLVKGHARAGYDVLKGVPFPWPVAQVALQHHERYDGSGYPHGLKGEAILLEARIMAVADVVEAMSSHRPYRPGLGIDKALAEIERGRGTAYCIGAADACLRLFREKGFRLPD